MPSSSDPASSVAAAPDAHGSARPPTDHCVRAPPESRPNPLVAYEDWPAVVRSAAPYVAANAAGTAMEHVLGLRQLPGRLTVLDEGSERVDGVVIRRLRWSVGYGPDTIAWLLRPTSVPGILPGVIGMHCHGGVRSVGAEQLVDLGGRSHPRAVWLRTSYYSGRAPANELARRGLLLVTLDHRITACVVSCMMATYASLVPAELDTHS